MAEKYLKYYDVTTGTWESPYAKQSDVTQLGQNLTTLSQTVARNEELLTEHFEESAKSFAQVFSRATNLIGNQIIDIGFETKFIQITAYLGVNDGYMSIGNMSVNTNTQSRLIKYAANSQVEIGTGSIIELHSGNGYNNAVCSVNDNEITLTWSKGGEDLPTDTIKFLVSAW